MLSDAAKRQWKDGFAPIRRNFRFEFFDLNFQFDSFVRRHRVHPVPLQKILAIESYGRKRENGFAAIWRNSLLEFFDV